MGLLNKAALDSLPITEETVKIPEPIPKKKSLLF
jgi:hypothetical protein